MKTRYWLYIVCKPYVLSASMGMWKPTLLPSVVLEGLINQCTNELSAKYDRIKYFCGCGSVNQSFPDFMGLPHRRFWARYQCPPPLPAGRILPQSLTTHVTLTRLHFASPRAREAAISLLPLHPLHLEENMFEIKSWNRPIDPTYFQSQPVYQYVNSPYIRHTQVVLLWE